MDSNSDKIYDVIILGAGISGLGSAYKLLEKNNTSFMILEKFSDKRYNQMSN